MPDQTSEAQPTEASARRDALYAELGTTGLTRFGYNAHGGESVIEEKLRELQGREGHELYRQMRLNHPVIAAMVYALTWAMRKVDFKAIGAADGGLDGEAADFLDGAMDDLSFSRSDTLSFIVDPLFEQGFSLVELVYKKSLGRNPRPYAGILPGEEPPKSQFDDGLIRWRKWPPRPVLSLAPGAEWQLDDTGGVQGVWQEGVAPKYDKKYIPIERLLHFRTTAAPGNSPEGLSVLRPAYFPYFYATQIAEVEAIGIERSLNGLPVVYLGRGSSLDTGTNSDFVKAQNLVTSIRRDAQAGVVFPGPKMTADGAGFLLELLSGGSTSSVDTDIVIGRYHKLMALSILGQFIFLGMENTGALATARVQAGFFNMALNGWAQNIVDVITRHAIPRLLALNPKFSALKELPQMTHSDAGVPDLEALANFVNLTVGAKVLTPDENLETYLRQTAGLPEKAEPLEIAPEPVESIPGAEADTEDEVEDTEDAIDEGDDIAEDDAEQSTAPGRAVRFRIAKAARYATRNSPGNPTFERETNAYQTALEDAYATWTDRTARDLAAADDDEQRSTILDAALLVLATQLIRLGREHLPRAVTTGAGNVPPGPATWAAMQAALAENEQHIRETLVPAIEQRVRAGLDDADVVVGGKTAIGGIFQTVVGKVGQYANPFYMLIWHAWQSRVEDASARQEQPARVRWVLDDRAHHCEDCLAAAGEYDSWDEMLMSVPGLPGSPMLIDRGNCRCHLEVEVNGNWVR